MFPMTPSEYRRYLRSADFDVRVRQPALRRAGGRCENCHEPLAGRKVDVHHETYFGIGTPAELDRVRVVCGRCHKAVRETTRIGHPTLTSST